MTSLVNVSVPRVVASLMPERVYTRQYPQTGDSEKAIAVWLTEFRSEDASDRWQLGDSDDPRGVMATVKRLRFMRWRYEADFLARGRRLP